MEENQLPDNMMKVVYPYGLSVLLVKNSGNIYAISNKCAHMGCTLSRGQLVGTTVKCPCHEWMFDLQTGAFVTADQIKIPVYESKVEKHKIYVKI
jgi:nitrite reductase/ring-hydroxylating ferredoxin subunit